MVAAGGCAAMRSTSVEYPGIRWARRGSCWSLRGQRGAHSQNDPLGLGEADVRDKYGVRRSPRWLQGGRVQARRVVGLLSVIGFLSVYRVAYAEDIEYLRHQLQQCGPDHNIRKDSKREEEQLIGWTVLDNEEDVAFEKQLSANESIEYSQGHLFLRRVNWGLRTQTIELLGADGRRRGEVVSEALRDVHIATSLQLVFVLGPYLDADGKELKRRHLRAYSLMSGKRINGDLPNLLALDSVLLTRPGWRAAWLVAADNKRGVTVTGFGERLRRHAKREIAGRGHRLEFACATERYVCGVLTSTADGSRSVFAYDVATGGLRTLDLRGTASAWLEGRAAGSRLMAWGRYELAWIDLERMEVVRQVNAKLQRGYRFEPHAAVGKRGELALVCSDSYHRVPVHILVYGPEGRKREQVELRPGWVEHVKFTGTKELMVFARRYVARVTLQTSQDAAVSPSRRRPPRAQRPAPDLLPDAAAASSLSAHTTRDCSREWRSRPHGLGQDAAP